ncbi:putative DNA-binding transcriptional regulator AlpA [Methylobacterium brachythecii]|uniref:Putative DNA-binding transcriptional regulator AlpA n=1 Tax=Methylobacterium brachythecii TaxID=1176177 RepID=A0A7W6AHN4_9HYPH|nr:putative DNA-binding transcriptional regulator AlpA [Methylobacterium brachythecii]GLS42923.1 hypothetical protein GCM10007884_09080 [Methylobacterium brachythecii]
MTPLADLPPDVARRRIIGTRDAAAFCGLSIPTFRRLHDRKAIPAGIRLSERRLGWRIGDLSDWTDCRAAGREWHEYRASLAGNDNLINSR